MTLILIQRPHDSDGLPPSISLSLFSLSVFPPSGLDYHKSLSSLHTEFHDTHHDFLAQHTAYVFCTVYIQRRVSLQQYTAVPLRIYGGVPTNDQCFSPQLRLHLSGEGSLKF